MRKEHLLENERELTQQDINQLEVFADKLFAKVGIDVEFTRHFLDRVNDERNKRQITMGELTRLFKQEFKRWGKPIAKMGPDAEAVMKDLKTDINLPFALNWDNRNNELDLVAKTVMRKQNFKTPNKEFPVESVSEKDESPLDVYTPTIKELQKKYEVRMKDLKRQIEKGVDVEMEHTTDPKAALEIALDHINEDLFYYEKLAKVEKNVNESVLSEAPADDIMAQLSHHGYDKIRRYNGNQVYVYVDQKSEDLRRQVAQQLLQKLDGSEPGNSKTVIKYLGGQIQVKPPEKTGINSAGIKNEVHLVNTINKFIKERGPLNITFLGDNGRKITVKDVTEASPVGADTKNRKKSDVNLISKTGHVPLSLKQVDAEAWESADTLWGHKADAIVDRLSEEGRITLTPLEGETRKDGSPIYKINPEVAIECTAEETLDVIFGNDILAGKGAVVKQTYKDEHYYLENNELTITAQWVILQPEDIPDDERAYWLIRNDRSRKRSTYKYGGLRVQAVSKKRINKNTLIINEGVINRDDILSEAYANINQRAYEKGYNLAIQGKKLRDPDSFINGLGADGNSYEQALKAYKEGLRDGATEQPYKGVSEDVAGPIKAIKNVANLIRHGNKPMKMALDMMHKIITKKGSDANHSINWYADKVARQFPEGVIDVRSLIDAYEEQYGVTERKLSGGEKRSKEAHFKKLKKHKGDFEKRYGKDAESVMHAVATKHAKNENKNMKIRDITNEDLTEGEGPCWDGYEKVPGKKDYEKGSCRKIKEIANNAKGNEVTIEGYDEIRGDLSSDLNEAEYQGRKVELNKPIRSSGGPKKFHVFVKNDKGNVVKVNFGDPNMSIKKSNPERRKSFRARHNCDNPGPKTSARYWSCRKW